MKPAIRVLYPDRIERQTPDLGLGQHELQQMQDWARDSRGMFLSVGPTGSGKTTTVYALLHSMARQGKHIVTVEDPAEYSIPGVTQIQIDEHHDLHRLPRPHRHHQRRGGQDLLPAAGLHEAGNAPSQATDLTRE